MRYFKSAFILGSTSSVAKSICIELAKNGCKKFHLVCRNLESNKDLVKLLEKYYGANVTEEKNDILFNCDLSKPYKPKVDIYDLYLIAIGTLGNEKLARVDIAESLKINFANYTGIITWLIQIMKNNRIESKGSLWVFSSVACDKGRASNYNYGAAKAALTTYCEGLLLRCYKKPFSVRIIKAGFMSTQMASNAPSYLCTNTDKVASYLMRKPFKRGIEYLPWWWSIVMFIVRNLPSKFVSKL